MVKNLNGTGRSKIISKYPFFTTAQKVWCLQNHSAVIGIICKLKQTLQSHYLKRILSPLECCWFFSSITSVTEESHAVFFLKEPITKATCTLLRDSESGHLCALHGSVPGSGQGPWCHPWKSGSTFTTKAFSTAELFLIKMSHLVLVKQRLNSDRLVSSGR